MNNHPRAFNIAFAFILALIYIIPSLWFSGEDMLDIVSLPMLVFGIFGLYLILPEALSAFWSGDRSRTAIGLYSVALMLLAVVIMRPYGLASRNIAGAKDWLEQTDIYAVAVYMSFVGIWFFTRASNPPAIERRGAGIGQLVAGIIIGALVASSRILEPVVVFMGKVISSMMHLG